MHAITHKFILGHDIMKFKLPQYYPSVHFIVLRHAACVHQFLSVDYSLCLSWNTTARGVDM